MERRAWPLEVRVVMGGQVAPVDFPRVREEARAQLFRVTEEMNGLDLVHF